MRSLTLLLSLPLWLLACGEKEDPVDPLTVDDDGDGFTENDGDCNDSNPDIKPGGDEICDFYDNDCDGLTDDEDDSLIQDSTTTFYLDNDRDGYGDDGVRVNACIPPEAHIVANGDCDDSDADINPDAAEICDEIDNDCDELTDDEDDSLNTSTGSTFYIDADGDGEGSFDGTIEACAVPDGYSALSSDCDDSAEDLDGDGEADGAAFNNLDEDNDGLTTCGADTDGDGVIDERDCSDASVVVGARDNDGDGFIDCINDCDDNDVYTYPGAGFNEVDNVSCMTDSDGDGYGDPEPSEGVVAGTDCNDADAAINPHDIDNDGVSSCAGDCDDSDATIGTEDYDGDGYSACIDDCDDTNPNAYPGAAYNEPDIDGDGIPDCAADNDGDGYAGTSTFPCYDFTLFDSYGDGWNGNAIEVYEDGTLTQSIANQNLDGVSYNSGAGEYNYVNFCPGSGTQSVEFYFVDGSFNSEVFFEMYDDAGNLVLTGQGSGTTNLIVNGITFTNGDLIYTAERQQGTDCDDNDANTIGDADGDGYTFCTLDCDDNDANVNPDATEVYYDGIDSDCDGMSDFDSDMDGVDVYEADCDGDGVLETACDFDGDGSIDWRGGRDCDDNDATTTGDDDGDGFLVCGDDCNDNDVTINPSANEIFYDGIDQNCVVGDEFDQDGDGDLIDEVDCNGTMANTCDFDGDGVDDFVGGTDCDDTSAGRNGLDTDMDGFTSCPDVNGLSDCDDDSAVTYPGIATNEFSYDANDLSTHYCATDADGDGYAASPAYSCYRIDMTDSYGDGWNGNALDIYVDDVWMTSLSNQNLANGFYTPETESATFCPSFGSVSFEFVDGDFTDEVSFDIYYDDGANGILIGSGMGMEPSTMIFESVNYTDGEIVYSELWGEDSDDGDANVY